MNSSPHPERPYWNTAPIDFLTATGAVVARWGRFEQIFEGFAAILGRPTHLQAQVQCIPISFSKKSDLIQSLAQQAFAHSPSLVAKIDDFHVRARNLSKKRNIIAHGLWFDHRNFNNSRISGVVIQEKYDGSRGFYAISKYDLEKLSVDIEQIMILGMELHWMPSAETSDILSADELETLRDYHRDYPEIPEVGTKYRGPKAKGNLPRPKLFCDLP